MKRARQYLRAEKKANRERRFCKFPIKISQKSFNAYARAEQKYFKEYH